MPWTHESISDDVSPHGVSLTGSTGSYRETGGGQQPVKSKELHTIRRDLKITACFAGVTEQVLRRSRLMLSGREAVGWAGGPASALALGQYQHRHPAPFIGHSLGTRQNLRHFRLTREPCFTNWKTANERGGSLAHGHPARRRQGPRSDPEPPGFKAVSCPRAAVPPTVQVGIANAVEEDREVPRGWQAPVTAAVPAAGPRQSRGPGCGFLGLGRALYARVLRPLHPRFRSQRHPPSPPSRTF